MDNMNVAAVAPQKSNAPLVLGIVGFGLGLPQALCLAFCSVLFGAGASALASEGVAIEGAGASMAMLIIATVLELVASIGGFIACFQTKKEGKAKTAGVMMIVAGALMLIATFIAGGWLLGLPSGILFLIGGILAQKNAACAAC